MLKKQHMAHELSRRERQIMDLLFQHGESSARAVLARLPDPPGYSAVRALLAKLVEKRQVHFRLQGRRYLFRPSGDPDAARSSALRHLVRTFFGDSPVRAANALLGMQTPGLSADEVHKLKALVDELDEEIST